MALPDDEPREIGEVILSHQPTRCLQGSMLSPNRDDAAESELDCPSCVADVTERTVMLGESTRLDRTCEHSAATCPPSWAEAHDAPKVLRFASPSMRARAEPTQ